MNQKIQKLQKRWETEDQRIQAIITAIKANKDWTIFLVDNPQNPYGALKFVDDGVVKKHDTINTAPRDLRGITLNSEEFFNVSVLSETSFSYSNLSNINFTNSVLTSSKFESSTLADVKFDNTNLFLSSFNKSKVSDASFAGAKLKNSEFNDTSMKRVVFSEAETDNISFNKEPTFGHLLKIVGIKKGTSIEGLLNAISEANNDFERFLLEQERIEKIKRSGKVFAWIFYLLTNYGRSFRRLGFMILLMWLFFGFLYAGYPAPSVIEKCQPCKEILTFFSPEIDWGSNDGNPKNWFDPYYFSIATSTTLTFGDITPKCLRARIYICLEVIISYIYLGVFVAMIASYEGR